TNALSGEAVIQTFEALRCNLGLIGVSGVAPSGGLFVKHRWEAKYRAAIVRTVSNEIYICTDVEKLGNHDLWQFATIDEIVADKPKSRVVLITNKPRELREHRLKVRAEETLRELTAISKRLGPQRFEVVVV
ncbi:MAG TPA: hypothetical protein VFV87_12660, partial [Pirellulaceae bacterium]|nr:hypothetical protein [Pirellulaceae bacterium]